MAGKGTKAAAKKMGVTPRRVRQLIKSGKVKASKKTGHDYTVSSTGGYKKKKKSGPKKSSVKKRSRS